MVVSEKVSILVPALRVRSLENFYLASSDRDIEADDYARNIARKARCHVLLLNRVALGKSFSAERNAQHLTSPPPGYHSVLGVPGTDLNYEETVVYSNNAIRPGYLVVYGEPPNTSKGSLKESFRKFFTTPVVS